MLDNRSIQMGPRILIVESNPPELALATKRGAEATAAKRAEAALVSLAPDLVISHAEPYFSDFQIEAYDVAQFDGVFITGGGVTWSAGDEDAASVRDMCAAAFAQSVPVFGSGFGMQIGALILGADITPCAQGTEGPIAREIQPADHGMMSGRRSAFDAVCMHGEEVRSAPVDSVITASNQHSQIQGLVCEQGGVRFWGTQYRPECGLRDAAFWCQQPHPAWGPARIAMARDLQLIDTDAMSYAHLCATHRVGIDLMDQGYHRTELTNWLSSIVRKPDT